ncbi:MAG TPA: 4Fe-4S binding protein [Desulfuromonadales bacterium]|nr:4Fe-4S binding protein [Desulfuromonadales bacterium]
MSISRKDFFRQGFSSLGKAAFEIADTIKGHLPALPVMTQMVTPPPSEARPDLVAEAFNDRCLARNNSCSACVESCKPKAIKLNPGVGIRINPQFCNGCGDCEYVCPVEPKAVFLAPRDLNIEKPDNPYTNKAA